MTKKQYRPTFGSISHGTMLPEDLIPAFVSELELCSNGNPADKPLIDEANALEDYESDEAQDILNDLFDALSNYAPSYGYFGSHPGDGADYGFWLSEEFQHIFREGDGLEVSDTSEVPEDYSGEVLHVNDHGNATLYWADKGKLNELWSVV